MAPRPLVIVAQLMFTIGVCWVLSLAVLLLRDIKEMLMYVTIALMVVTPIAYTPNMVSAQLKILTAANPLYYYISCYQHLIIFNKLPPAWIAITALLLSLISFWAAYTLLQKAKQTFYDYA